MKIIKNIDLFGMANIRGRFVKNPNKLNFSFYFSSGAGKSHEIRVKPMFNPEKLILSKTGTLKLCDDWGYIPGTDDKAVNQKDVNDMKQFFRDYLVLFCAVWDEQLDDGSLEDYFKGEITFNELLQNLDFYPQYKDELNQINMVSSLEKFCRVNNLVNLRN